MTQEQLGQKLHVSSKTVSHWETGRSYPEINIIPNICNVIDIELDVF